MRKNFIKYLTILAFAALQPLFSSAENAHGPAMAASAAAPLVPQAAEIPKPKDRAKVYLAILKSSEVNSEKWFKYIGQLKAERTKQQLIDYLRDSYVQQQFLPNVFKELFIQLGLKFSSDWSNVTQNDAKAVQPHLEQRHFENKFNGELKEENTGNIQQKRSPTQDCYNRFVQITGVNSNDNPLLIEGSPETRVIALTNSGINVFISDVQGMTGPNNMVYKQAKDGDFSFKPIFNPRQSYIGRTVYYEFIPAFLGKFDYIAWIKNHPDSIEKLFRLFDTLGESPGVKSKNFELWNKIRKFVPIYQAEIELFLKHDQHNAFKKYEKIIRDKSPYSGLASLRLAEIQMGMYTRSFVISDEKKYIISDKTNIAAIKILEEAISSPSCTDYIDHLKFRLAMVYMGTFDKSVKNEIKAKKLLQSTKTNPALDHASLCKLAEMELHVITGQQPTEEETDRAQALIKTALACSGGEKLSTYLEIAFQLGNYGKKYKDVKKAIPSLIAVKDWYGLYEVYLGKYGNEFANKPLADQYLRTGAIEDYHSQIALAKQLASEGEIGEALFLLKESENTSYYTIALLARYYNHPRSQFHDPELARKNYEKLWAVGFYRYAALPLLKIYEKLGNYKRMQVIKDEYVKYCNKNKIKIDPSLIKIPIIEVAAASPVQDLKPVIAAEPKPIETVEYNEDEERKDDGVEEDYEGEYLDKIHKKMQSPAAPIIGDPPSFGWSDDVEELYEKFMSQRAMKFDEVRKLVLALGCTITPAAKPNTKWIRDINSDLQFVYHDHFADKVINFRTSYWRILKQMIEYIYEHGQV